MAGTSKPGDKLLYFEELNASGQDSIVFLHGGGGSHIEWEAVTAEKSLQSFHLILVDLPGHSGSRDIGPLSLESAADEVQKVIQVCAHGGKSHIVGLSLGAFVALTLTARHSHVVLSTFASGAYPYRGIFKWAMERPAIMRVLNSVENIPGVTAMTLRAQGINGEAWLAEMKKNQSWERTKAMMNELSHFGIEHIQAVADAGVRTCVVAGGKMDQIDPFKDMGAVLREGGSKKGVRSEAVVVWSACHPWHLQLPALFAAGVKGWVSDDDLPIEFEVL